MGTRMIRVMLASLVLVCLSAAAAEAQQPIPEMGEAQAKAQVEKVEQRWLGALERADTAAMAAILADDFVRPAPQAGTFITKSDLLSYYRAHLVPEQPGRKHIEGMSVAVYGRTAIARGKLVTRDATGHTIAQLLFTDVFVRRNGRWVAVSAQENRVSPQKP